MFYQSIFLLICLSLEVNGYVMIGVVNDNNQLCDFYNPCPTGSACRTSILNPGNRRCYAGSTDGPKHAGRCPGTSTTQTITSMTCMIDQDCPIDQKCCDSGNTISCTTAVAVPTGPTVTVLQSGSITPISQTTFDFIGSVALIQSQGTNVLFDTGGIGQKVSILQSLRDNAGLFPDDIDYIVTSHGHPDHSSNANLFVKALLNFNSFLNRGNRYAGNQFAFNEPYYLNNDANMQIIQTPGHTTQDTSLIVKNVVGLGTVAFSGDAIYYQGDNANPQLLSATNFNMTALNQSRKLIACQANYIVPGHGPMFQVTSAVKQTFGC